MFEGFPEETVRFFLELRLHNDHSYFKAHEDAYRRFVREPFYAFIEAVAPAALRVAEDMEVRPGKCLARIRRDTRFSKDKTPFRDHLWLLFRRSGEARDHSVMYWFELSPENVEWGLGFWGDNRFALDALRRRMVRQPGQVLSALEESGLPGEGFRILGERYQRMKIPEGLDERLAPYYPQKSLYIKREGIPLKTAYSGELVSLVSRDLLRLSPMYGLLRAAADEGMAQWDANTKKGIV